MLSKYLVSFLLIAGCGHKALRTNADFAKTTAMITLDNKHSGGTGVILKSTANSSLILTNRHVCALIQVGGVVTTDQGDYPVHSYRVYTRHDLCIIEVLANLHEGVTLAEQPPAIYTTATISGHPALLPTLITRGHFATQMPIQLMIGTKVCDGTETGDEASMCLFTGMKPIVLTYTAQPVTATIMAGSSGSGVFNNKGELAGLVFAGNQGLSYGFIVPYEYVRDFLTHAGQYPKQFPDRNAPPKDLFASMAKIQAYCSTGLNKCKGILTNELYTGL